MKPHPTLSDAKIWLQTRESHRILVQEAYPGLMDSVLLSEQQQVQKCMNEFFQPTPKRGHLIEWLVCQIMPDYEQVTLKGANKKKLTSYLWRLGVMPFSKHSKNMDYEKYVQGLLGYENAVNLIFNLCQLLKEERQLRKSREDTTFGFFLQEAINNYDELVNQHYDPYKISFPAAYQHLEQQEFQKQFQIVMAQLELLKNNSQHPRERTTDCQAILEQFQANKQKFKTVYEELVDKIRDVTSQYKPILKNFKKMQNIEGRTLKIPVNLPNLYRQYKQKINLMPFTASTIEKQKQEMFSLINGLNDTVVL